MSDHNCDFGATKPMQIRERLVLLALIVAAATAAPLWLGSFTENVRISSDVVSVFVFGQILAAILCFPYLLNIVFRGVK